MPDPTVAPSPSSPRARFSVRAIAAVAVTALLAGALALSPLVAPDAEASLVNLLTPNQQTLEADPTGWAAEPVARVSRTNQEAVQGQYSLRVAALAGMYNGTKPMQVTTSRGRSGAKVTPGVEYTGQFQVRPWEDFTDNVACELTWFGADGSTVSRSTGPWQAESANSWRVMSCKAVAPANAAYAALRVKFHSVYRGDVHFVDDAKLIPAQDPGGKVTTAPRIQSDPSTTTSTTLTTSTTVAPPTTTTTAPPATTITTAPPPPPPSVPSGSYPARGAVGFLGNPGSLQVIDGPEDAPAGTSWQNGYLQVDTANFTLDGVYVKGGIDFYGAGTLTVRNSIIEFGHGGWVTILGRTSGQTIDIRDSTVRYRTGAQPSANDPAAIQIQAGLTIVALRNDISGSTDGIQAAGPNTRIEQNWIHDLALVGSYPNNSHNDGVQIYDGHNMVIANNRIEIGFDGQHQNGALFFQPGGGNSIDVTISGNYLQGGGFTLRLEGPTTARVTNNTFGPLEGGWGTHYVNTGARVTQWSGNVRTDGSTVSA